MASFLLFTPVISIILTSCSLWLLSSSLLFFFFFFCFSLTFGSSTFSTISALVLMASFLLFTPVISITLSSCSLWLPFSSFLFFFFLFCFSLTFGSSTFSTISALELMASFLLFTPVTSITLSSCSLWLLSSSFPFFFFFIRFPFILFLCSTSLLVSRRDLSSPDFNIPCSRQPCLFLATWL